MITRSVCKGGGGAARIRAMTEARGSSDAGKETQTKECRWPLEARRTKDTHCPPAAFGKNRSQLQPSEAHFRLRTPGARRHLCCCSSLWFVLWPQQLQGTENSPHPALLGCGFSSEPQSPENNTENYFFSSSRIAPNGHQPRCLTISLSH